MDREPNDALLDYYSKTASVYDDAQIIPGDEHRVALTYLDGICLNEEPANLLDVGCGTGRALVHLSQRFPQIDLYGLDPSASMLDVCHRKGIARDHLFEGDACNLPFVDGSFDFVTAFGVLHHIKNPELAVQEMCRVARNSVFVSDHNVYGWGNASSVMIKNTIRRLGLWKVFVAVHTRGKGFYNTDYDGIFYPFSLLDHTLNFQRRFKKVSFLTTKSSGPSLYGATSHLCIYATNITELS